MLEIRWHGRGGQGTKTASLMFAEILFKVGKFAQGFPEYGPERTGAPLTTYNRISENKIRNHSNIYTPNILVIVDDSLIGNVDLLNGLQDNGKILVNMHKNINCINLLKNELKEKNLNNVKIYTLKGTNIAIEELGKPFPNIPMLSALVKITGILDEKIFFEYAQDAITNKFKKEVINGNLHAMERAFNEVEEI